MGSNTARSALAGLTMLLPAAALADPVSDFYRNRNITLLVGAAPGAIYDMTARTLARHIQKHIPGSPTIVIQNMPGASQIVATEYSYNVAPRDGSSLLVVQSSIILNKLLNPAARYEIQKFTWIGRSQKLEVGGWVWHTSKVNSFDDARKSPVTFGANSATGYTAIIPWALNRLAGTQFKIVRGYQSQRNVFLAVERGEVDGVGSSALGDIAGWIRDKKAKLLYVSQLQRHKNYPDTPSIFELVPPGENRDILALIGATSDVGVTLMGPPGIPEDRVAALRAAFEKAVKEPAFGAELRKSGFEPDLMTGTDVAKFVRDNISPTPALLEKFRAAVAPM